MDPEGYLVVAVIVVGLISFYRWRGHALKRRKAWRAFARGRGWQLVESPLPPVSDFLANKTARKPGLLQEYEHPLLHTGHYGRAPNLARGDYQGRKVLCFEYEYDEQPGSNSTLAFLCVLLPSPLNFPKLVVQPAVAAVGRATDPTGTQYLQFESADFNDRFLVQCRERRFAYDVLHPRALQLLMAADDVYLEAIGQSLLFYHYRQGGDLEARAERLLALGSAFLELLPAHLLAEQRGTRARPAGRLPG